MGQKIQIITILWLVAACLISGGEAQEEGGVSSSTVQPATSQTTILPTSEGSDSQSTTVAENPTTQAGNTAQSTEDPDDSTTPVVTHSQPTEDPDNSTTPVVTQQPATTIPSTEKPQNPCDKNPCGHGSTCVPRVEDFECLCLVGALYNAENKTCEPAKVFPGQLTMPGIEYNPDMADPTSAAFQSAAKTIEAGLDIVFETTDGFSQATVTKIEPLASRGWSRSKETVKATVGILFKRSSAVTEENIQTVMKEAAANPDSPLSGTAFEKADQCSLDPCDKHSTTCKKGDESFTCECTDAYVSTALSDRLCIACPSGFKAESNKCVNCPFGYSGFNCNESSKLVLVIVGSVLGALLLITLILLPVVMLKSSKKSSKKSKNAKNEDTFTPQPSTKAPMVNSNLANSHAAPANRPANGFANAGVPRIPRATTTSSWDRGTSLEMTPSHSRQNLVPSGRNTRQFDDLDDMPPQSRPQSMYGPARPQTNPYSQIRAQNPYSSSQGHTNPYYTNDDGRRY